eukprot:636048_1
MFVIVSFFVIFVSFQGTFDAEAPGFISLSRCALLCNCAKFKEDGTITGDASESALLKFASPHYDDAVEKFRSSYPERYGIPFNSENKWQMSIHSQPTGSHLLVLKGAPEIILDMCGSYRVDGQTQPLREESLAKIRQELRAIG